jgi:hypothetical protein
MPSIPGVAIRVDNDTAWNVFNTGLTVQFPPSATHTTMAINEAYGFEIYASRESGIGSLYSDCLILVPIDEYMLYYLLPSQRVVGIPGEYACTRFFIGPDGSSGVYQFSSATNDVIAIDIPYVEGDGPTPGDVYVYFLIFDSPEGATTLTSNTTVSMPTYPRYHSVQGAV